MKNSLHFMKVNDRLNFCIYCPEGHMKEKESRKDYKFISVLLTVKYGIFCTIVIFFPMPPHVPYGLRGLPSRLWLKFN
jgi:hypothetical protein